MKFVTIASKLRAAFLVILLGIIVMVIATYITNATISKITHKLTDETIHKTLLIKDLNLDVVQVQQWLTDISATRGVEGFNDGFDRAEEYAQAFGKKSQKLKEFFKEDSLSYQKMIEIEKSFAEYYKMGKEMAQQYIDNGHESGNEYMEKFDPFALKISTEIEELNKGVDIELSTELQGVESTISKALYVSLGVGIFLVLITIVLSIYISNGIRRPIDDISKTLKEIAEGDGDLTHRLNENRRDEIGDMARYFNRFVSKLQSILGEVIDSTTTVASAATELSAVSSDIARSTEAVSNDTYAAVTITDNATNNINSISITANDMSQSASSVANAIEAVNVSLNEITQKCQTELKIATEASHYARQGKDSIDTLGAAAQSIGKIVEVINGIADKTNLLALNATIEAASAGDAGRGFAVVANEVKGLSRQTANAIQEIENEITQMQNKTKSAIETIIEIARVIEEVNHLSDSIVSSVEEQSQTINAIVSNIKSVQVGTEEVAMNVSESAQGVSEVAHTIEGVNRTMATTSSGIVQVQSSADELARMSEGLKSKVSQFKV